jgi:hypothetical protein
MLAATRLSNRLRLTSHSSQSSSSSEAPPSSEPLPAAAAGAARGARARRGRPPPSDRPAVAAARPAAPSSPSSSSDAVSQPLPPPSSSSLSGSSSSSSSSSSAPARRRGASPPAAAGRAGALTTKPAGAAAPPFLSPPPPAGAPSSPPSSRLSVTTGGGGGAPLRFTCSAYFLVATYSLYLASLMNLRRVRGSYHTRCVGAAAAADSCALRASNHSCCAGGPRGRGGVGGGGGQGPYAGTERAGGRHMRVRARARTALARAHLGDGRQARDLALQVVAVEVAAVVLREGLLVGEVGAAGLVGGRGWGPGGVVRDSGARGAGCPAAGAGCRLRGRAHARCARRACAAASSRGPRGGGAHGGGLRAAAAAARAAPAAPRRAGRRAAPAAPVRATRRAGGAAVPRARPPAAQAPGRPRAPHLVLQKKPAARPSPPEGPASAMGATSMRVRSFWRAPRRPVARRAPGGCRGWGYGDLCRGSARFKRALEFKQSVTAAGGRHTCPQAAHCSLRHRKPARPRPSAPQPPRPRARGIRETGHCTLRRPRTGPATPDHLRCPRRLPRPQIPSRGPLGPRESGSHVGNRHRGARVAGGGPHLMARLRSPGPGPEPAPPSPPPPRSTIYPRPPTRRTARCSRPTTRRRRSITAGACARRGACGACERGVGRCGTPRPSPIAALANAISPLCARPPQHGARHQVQGRHRAGEGEGRAARGSGQCGQPARGVGAAARAHPPTHPPTHPTGSDPCIPRTPLQAVEKLVVSKLLVERSSRRIHNVDRHAGIVSGGRGAGNGGGDAGRSDAGH